LILKDEDARKIIATQLDENLLVEAGAGSGKTHEMANRILALIKSETAGRKIGEIVAITFTRKAANELRERIRKTLEKEYDALKTPILKDALDHIHECFIGTIHSFCAKILRERPIEAGVDPGFNEIDPAKDSLLLQKTWDLYIQQADDKQKNILKWMDIFGVRSESAREFLQVVCENQDVDFVLPNDGVLEPDIIFAKVEDVLEKVYELVKSHHDIATEAIETSGYNADGLQSSITRFYRMLHNRKITKLTKKEQFSLLMVYSTEASVGIVQRRWATVDKTKDETISRSELFVNLRNELVLPMLKEIDKSVYAFLLTPFVLDAQEIYRKQKHEIAEINFQDILVLTATLLKKHPEVREHFQKRYKTLLIDEFQDTDPIQTEIAMYLTGEQLLEKNWQKISPRKGSLFVVGDPKQSIYAFRRADIRLYSVFKKHLERVGRKTVELQTNFRSTDELGTWYNTAFKSLLSDEEQAQYTKMDTVYTSLDNTLSGVAYYKIDAKKIEDVIYGDIKVLTQIITNIVGKKEITLRKTDENGQNVRFEKRKVRYNDIMVLALKKEKLLEPIAHGIAKSGIPVRITGADITKRTSEFNTFAELIRLLANPGEKAYVYNVMSGDLFNFSVADIAKFYDNGGEFNIYFDFDSFYQNNSINDDVVELFEGVRECFKKLRKYSGYMHSLSPAAATERIIEDLDILKKHLHSNEVLSGLGSFVSLVEKIRLKRITDVWGLNVFIDELSYMINNGFEEDVDIEGSDIDAVRFMNLHKAKGLEAPVVILCGPCSGGVFPPTFYTEKVTDEFGNEKNIGYVRVAKNPDSKRKKKYFEPHGWDKIDAKAVKADQLERKRLLYVAATRARNYLIIGDSEASGKDKIWDELVQLLPEEKDILDNFNIDELAGCNKSEETAVFYEADVQNKLDIIRTRRDEAFYNNKPTFKVVAPSRLENDNDDPHEINAATIDNSMSITVNGEEISIIDDSLKFGIIVHEIIDALIKDEASLLPKTINLLLKEYGEKQITREFLKGIAETFKNSGLWDRIQESDKFFSEIPFFYKVPEHETLEDTYVNGVIDLIFKEKDGWVIADYKTHDGTGDLNKLQAEYSLQLETYKKAWQEMTGEKVKETVIFFIKKMMTII